MHRLVIAVALCLIGCGHPDPSSSDRPVSGSAISTQITEVEAKELAQQFVDKEWRAKGQGQGYVLEFESVRLREDGYQVRYSPKYDVPTKSSPPYRLVLVRFDRTVAWELQ